jgi:tetratricopeptide (TPR) repeat protein
MTHTEMGSFTASRQLTERVLLLTERHGFRMVIAYATAWRGWIAFYAGEWVAARRDFEQAAAIGREVGPFFGSFYPPLGLGMLCLAEGAQAEASRHLGECERLLRSGGDAYMRRQVAWVLAERDLGEGQPEEACARLAPSLAQGALEEDTAPSLPLLAQALLALGEMGEAAEVAARAVARARETGRQVLLVDALRVVPLVVARQGRWAEAEDALHEGLALARHIGYPYGEARLLQVYGAVLAHMGQPAAAREQLEMAVALVRRLDAQREMQLLEQDLTGLSQNPRASRNYAVAPAEHRVTAVQWTAISALLPPQARTGRPRADDRQTIAAILYKLETGCAWRSIPAVFGAGATAHRRLQAWQAAGVWDQIMTIMQDRPQ